MGNTVKQQVESRRGYPVLWALYEVARLRMERMVLIECDHMDLRQDPLCYADYRDAVEAARRAVREYLEEAKLVGFPVDPDDGVAMFDEPQELYGDELNNPLVLAEEA